MKEMFRLIDAVPDMGRHNTIHRAAALLKLMVVAAAAGIRGWVATARFAAEHHEFFVEELGLSPKQPPSPRTIARAAPKMPDIESAPPTVPETPPDREEADSSAPLPPLVAIDGKTLRGSRRRKGAAPEVIVSAVDSEGRTLATEPLGPKENVSGKEGEIPATLRLIPRVCGGRLVTMDALFCFPAAAQAVLDAGGHYALSCKSNAGRLHVDAEGLFLRKPADGIFDSGWELAHGRIERRICEVVGHPKLLEWPWFETPLPKMACVARIRRIREEKTTGKVSEETAYRMFDLPMTAEEALAVDRWHWTIENRTHHVLDTTFAEDACRIRGESARLWSSLRRLAIPILRKLMPGESIAMAALSVLARPRRILPIRSRAVSPGVK